MHSLTFKSMSWLYQRQLPNKTGGLDLSLKKSSVHRLCRHISWAITSDANHMVFRSCWACPWAALLALPPLTVTMRSPTLQVGSTMRPIGMASQLHQSHLSSSSTAFLDMVHLAAPKTASLFCRSPLCQRYAPQNSHLDPKPSKMKPVLN